MADLRRKKDPPPVLRSDIYQGNPLMESRKVFDTLGMRIFALGLRGLNPHFSLRDKKYDEKFPELFIPTSMIVELFGGNTKYLHDLKSACKRLFDTIIEIDKANGGFTLMHLFNRLEYKPNEGLYLQFDELMRPYLLDLFESGGYTKISVEQVFYLTSPYAWRLLELMLQYQNISEFQVRQKVIREIDMENLKFYLNIPEDAYEGRIDNFRKYVLDDPIAEINEKTIYQMGYEVMKTGRSVSGFRFHMNAYAASVEDERLKYTNDAIKQLCALGFTLEASKKILAVCDDEKDCLARIAKGKKILEKQKSRETVPVSNELGFLRTAIIENWSLEPKRAKKPKTVAKSKKTPLPKDIFATNRKKKAELAEDIPIKKTEIPVGMQEMLRDMLNGGAKNKKMAESVLRSAGWSLKEFNEKYCKSDGEN